MSIEVNCSLRLVPVERRWPPALAALFRRIRLGTRFRAPTGTGFRKRTASREAQQ